MTREELIEELNKIKDIAGKYYLCSMGNFVEIRCNGGILLCYYDNNDIDIEGMFFHNRTPEQVLSVVKALVG